MPLQAFAGGLTPLGILQTPSSSPAVKVRVSACLQKRRASDLKRNKTPEGKGCVNERQRGSVAHTLPGRIDLQLPVSATFKPLPPL